MLSELFFEPEMSFLPIRYHGVIRSATHILDPHTPVSIFDELSLAYMTASSGDIIILLVQPS